MKSKHHFNKGWEYYEERLNSRRYWRSSTMSNSFRSYIPYHYRILPMQQFYRKVDEKIRHVYQLTGYDFVNNDDKRVKAQLSVCYTHYPQGIGVQAAIGSTAWLQFKKLSTKQEVPVNPPASLMQFALNSQVDMKIFTEIYQQVYKMVQERLACEELKKSGIIEVEAYRFVLLNYHRLQMRSLPDIIHVAVMLGDLLPDLYQLELHPVTMKVMEEILSISVFYYKSVEKANIAELLRIRHEWISAICKSVCRFLPSELRPLRNVSGNQEEDGPALGNMNSSAPKPNQDFPGLNKPGFPFINEEKDPVKLIQSLLFNNRSGNEVFKGGDSAEVKLTGEAKAAFDQLSQVINTVLSTSGQTNKFEDIRSDIIQDTILNSPFQSGPIEGTSAEGNDVEADLGDGMVIKEHVFDKSFVPSFDEEEIKNLIRQAEPLTASMKRNIFPNVEEIALSENLKTSGMIDPIRLTHYQYSDAIYKRVIHRQEFNKKGRPVILIACDGSGSMDRQKMMMLKLLTVAWIGSTLNTSIQLIGAMYNEGQVDKGRNGTLVRWFCHPAKTVSNTRQQALRSVASLPDSGDGYNPDALALAFLIHEAEVYARGKQIYLVHICDTQWCNSFQQGISPEEEVVRVVGRKKQVLGKRFHYTLVGLSTTSGGKVGQFVADKFIPLSATELTNPLAAARKVGDYVSSCLKERSRQFTTL